jgi:hypothetical protein
MYTLRCSLSCCFCSLSILSPYRSLLLALSVCRFLFRLNCGVVADFLLLNAYGFADPSPFLCVLSAILSLYRSLLFALSLCRFHFRLNGGFGAFDTMYLASQLHLLFLLLSGLIGLF